MKKVLIVTYYWPPAGGAGVQRILKFTQYLSEFGWQPIVLAPKEGEYPGLDPQLTQEIPQNCLVYKSKIFEPGKLYKKFIGIKKNNPIPVAVLTEQNINWKKKIANWIRINLFIPDAKIGWKNSAVKMATRIIHEHKPDIIFSSSPPPSVHLIANKISKKFKIKWVADFRDPWTKIHYYNQIKRSPLSHYLDIKLEKKVLQQANRITVVNNNFFNSIEKNKEIVIPNGYDPNDFPKTDNKKNKKFTICYSGSLKARQYVDALFDALKDICAENENLIQINIWGNTDENVKNKILEKKINCQIEFKGFVAHNIILSEILTADMLLLIIGKSDRAKDIFSTKVFEYLYVRKPILAICFKESAVDKLIQRTKSGSVFEYNDKSGIMDFINSCLKSWKNNAPITGFNNTEIEKYNRKVLTERLTKTFEETL